MANTIQEFNFDINIPFVEDINYNTLITRYEDGKEQRRQKWSRPKRMYSISLRGKSKTIFNQIWNFYNSRSGAFDTFYFTNPNETPVANEVFGTGNGSTTVFTLANSPIPSGTMSISVGGVAKTESTHYTVNRSTGVITFNTPPSGGLSVTAVSYNFSRIVRFAEDKLGRELFSYQLYNGNLKLTEVLQ